MSRPAAPARLPSGHKRAKSLTFNPGPTSPTSTRPRRLSTAGGAKAHRTSKTSQKLVVLPSAPQTKPLYATDDEDIDAANALPDGRAHREYKSAGERMTKKERKRAGYKRITTYCIAEAFSMKLLAGFLKREHNVAPRVFDEALYVMYHLPLLPGYGPNSNFRSSVPAAKPGKSYLSRLSEAEEAGYQGTYFEASGSPSSLRDGYMTSGSPTDSKLPRDRVRPNDTADETDNETPHTPRTPAEEKREDANVAEVVFFDYGVVVFFGLEESQERGLIEDLESNGILKRKFKEDDWEIEECHYAHDPNIAYPRIYNDFFTFKSPSHLVLLSVSHALAQSTLLSYYETSALNVLSSPQATSIPLQLAKHGQLQMKRGDALRLTGQFFRLRVNVNLVSNVLDVPELFWSEASLGELYGAVREYLEIESRVAGLNAKLGTSSEFLEAIHDHLNYSAMERITWIIIYLIVVAIMVALGEVIARIVVHIKGGGGELVPTTAAALSRDSALLTLEGMINKQSIL